MTDSKPRLFQKKSSIVSRLGLGPGLVARLAAAGLASSSAPAEEAPAARHHLTGAQYQEAAVNYRNAGYRLLNVSGYEVSGSARYAAIWSKTSGPSQAAHHGMSEADYQAKMNAYANQGFRPAWVDGFNVGNQTVFAATWEKSDGSGWVAHHDMTSSVYQDKFNEYEGQGFRCVHVDGYRAGNSNRYAAIWVKDGGGFPRAHHGQSAADYQATVNQNIQDGYRPVHVTAWGVGKSARFASLWQKTGGDPFWMRHHLQSHQYQAEWENFHHTGYHLKRVAGYTFNGVPHFVSFWENPHMNAVDLNLIEDRIRAYIADQGIPGISVAIAKTGRLVYARGFGFADLENAELVSPRTRLRVASISKPITATAIMTLVDDEVISLDDKVFGPGALLGTQYGTPPYDSKVTAIRVKHLLWHCSGWSNESDDPMFNGHADHEAVIDWMLDNRDPLASPENSDEYLNFGYCVLGRIIEQVTGLSYESYVQQAVLTPCGIDAMEIGAQARADRKSGEAVYYHGNNPYSVIRPEHFDSHGGWIASATDLLRFKVRVDGSQAKPDIISSETYTAMMQASPASSSRAMGWRFGSAGYGHNGCMSGTIGFLWDTDDGYTFAILANTRPDDDGCAWNARAMIEEILYDVGAWPKYDLFSGSQKELPPLIVNPGVGELPDDLVFKSPTTLPAFPKFELVDLPSLDTAAGRGLTLEVPDGGEDLVGLLLPAVQAKRVHDAEGPALSLSFPAEVGWEYAVQRSAKGQSWSSQPVLPGRDGWVRFQAPAQGRVELFRVQMVPQAEVIGMDPTLLEPRCPIVREPIVRPAIISEPGMLPRPELIVRR